MFLKYGSFSVFEDSTLFYSETSQLHSFLLYTFSAEGDGSKIYVSYIAFQGPISEYIAEAY